VFLFAGDEIIDTTHTGLESRSFKPGLSGYLFGYQSLLLLTDQARCQINIMYFTERDVPLSCLAPPLVHNPQLHKLNPHFHPFIINTKMCIYTLVFHLHDLAFHLCPLNFLSKILFTSLISYVLYATSIDSTHLVEALRYKPEGRGFDFRLCHWNFSLTYSFRPRFGPGIGSASKKNKFQGYLL